MPLIASPMLSSVRFSDGSRTEPEWNRTGIESNLLICVWRATGKRDLCQINGKLQSKVHIVMFLTIRPEAQCRPVVLSYNNLQSPWPKIHFWRVMVHPYIFLIELLNSQFLYTEKKQKPGWSSNSFSIDGRGTNVFFLCHTDVIFYSLQYAETTACYFTTEPNKIRTMSVASHFSERWSCGRRWPRLRRLEWQHIDSSLTPTACPSVCRSSSLHVADSCPV